MFGLFKKSSKTKEISAITQTDMHNHLLPGIDDGSPNVEISIELIKGMQALGYSNFICTPHVFKEVHNNNYDTVSAAYDLLQSEIIKQNIPVKIAFGAEYMINHDFEQIFKSDKLLLLPNKHILIEMSYMNESSNIKSAIFDIQMKGLQPILAHPERYNFYHTRFDKYEQYYDTGVDLQLNLLSLTGYYGKEVKNIAERLLAKEMYTWIGTDLHHGKHLEGLQKLISSSAMEKLQKIKGLKNNSLF